MANSQSSSLIARLFKWLVLLLLVGLAAAAWSYRTPIEGYAGVATSYSARVACSCRFVAGRSLTDCEAVHDELDRVVDVALQLDVLVEPPHDAPNVATPPTTEAVATVRIDDSTATFTLVAPLASPEARDRSGEADCTPQGVPHPKSTAP